MADYRVYFVDMNGGIAHARWLNASNDSEAMSLANALEKQFVREVWHFQREVGKLPANNQQ